MFFTGHTLGVPCKSARLPACLPVCLPVWMVGWERTEEGMLGCYSSQLSSKPSATSALDSLVLSGVSHPAAAAQGEQGEQGEQGSKQRLHKQGADL